MRYDKINSQAKINLSLHVIKKLKNNYHNIESLVTFLKLSDDILVRKSSIQDHKVLFYGKFAKGINNQNTITKLLSILDKKNLLSNQKFEIKVKKNIPQQSGMGGGSMNAASILRYFIKKKIINISNAKVTKIANLIGSDVVLGLEKKNSILFNNGKIERINYKTNLHVLVAKPNINYSTRSIYLKVKNYSKPIYVSKNQLFFKINNLARSVNDLEDIVFKKYLSVKNLNFFLSNLPGVIFARMTGTGSAIVAYFKNKRTANNAAKIFMKKYRNYLFIVSKTI